MTYRPNDDPVNTKYVVNHERTGGMWGKTQRIPRRQMLYQNSRTQRYYTHEIWEVHFYLIALFPDRNDLEG
jgi:hypothetical protein